MTDAEQREPTAVDVAKFFLHIAAEQGDELDQPTLQRLCYYAQGYHLASNWQPLFREAIEACDDGPVIRELQHEFAACAPGSVPPDPMFDVEQFDVMDGALMRGIYREFRAGGEDDRITAEHADWLLRVSRRDDREVTFEDMHTCFSVAMQRQPPSAPAPPMSPAERNVQNAQSLADIKAGRMRRYRPRQRIR